MRQRSASGDDRRVLVIGSDPAGTVVARRLSTEVEFLGLDDRITDRVVDAVGDVSVVDGVGNAPEWTGRIDAAVVATDRDSTNLLAAQRLRLATNADIVVRLNDPVRERAFADLGVETVCAASRVGESLMEAFARDKTVE